MLRIKYSNIFKKDVSIAKKRGKDLEKLKTLISIIAENKPLLPKYRDHSLIGNYRGQRECHIEPNWLLIYKREADLLVLERTGTHSDLFK